MHSKANATHKWAYLSKGTYLELVGRNGLELGGDVLDFGSKLVFREAVALDRVGKVDTPRTDRGLGRFFVDQSLFLEFPPEHHLLALLLLLKLRRVYHALGGLLGSGLLGLFRGLGGSFLGRGRGLLGRACTLALGGSGSGLAGGRLLRSGLLGLGSGRRLLGRGGVTAGLVAGGNQEAGAGEDNT